MNSLKKFLILPALLLFVGCGSSVSTPGTTSDSSLKILENNIDLGQIPIMNGTVDAVFTFRNDGTEPVTIGEAQTSCMCTEAEIRTNDGSVSPRIKMAGHGPLANINKTIAPGEEATLIATYDPLAHGPNATGPVKRDIMITTNSTTTPDLKFSFMGDVIK